MFQSSLSFSNRNRNNNLSNMLSNYCKIVELLLWQFCSNALRCIPRIGSSTALYLTADKSLHTETTWPSLRQLCVGVLSIIGHGVRRRHFLIGNRRLTAWVQTAPRTTYIAKVSVQKNERRILIKLVIGVYTVYKLRGLSPLVNYSNRATTACRRSWCQLLRIESARWSAWWIPTAVFSVF
jgi:hypothetical protein